MKPILRKFLAPYRLATDDLDLLRAQFADFLRQIPLLYGILAASLAAEAVKSWPIPVPPLLHLLPLALCVVFLGRAWWWRLRRHAHFSDAEIRHHMRSTNVLAPIMAATVVGWFMLVFPDGTDEQRDHLLFFLSITVISCVFCLMSVRSAALGVATAGLGPTIVYLMVIALADMWTETIIIGMVGMGMIAVTIRHNRSFAELISSQRDLRLRQIETERLSEENREIALTDALSGLPNRRALISRLEEVRDRSQAGPVRVAILFIDLDGFKQVNDTFGHELGDTIIRRISREFARLVPRDATLYRMGGDEFAILIEAMPGDSGDATAAAMTVARSILDWLALPLRLAGHEFQLGASIGVAGTGDGPADPYELLRRADTAMYRAKAQGGSDVLAYDPAMDEGRSWRQQVEAEIRHGLEQGEFDVHYQPLVDATSGETIAVEALARWPGRAAGAMGPDEFIPVAETCGLIHQLGLFVLRRACLQVVELPHIRLNVNVSPAQFRHPHFEQEVTAVLQETGFPPERLQIEITEGYLIDNPDRANCAIAAFTALGIRVTLDDFGSGFASIGYLRNFPFSSFKIDRSLASGFGSDPKASMLIAGMVHLANGLDMAVTAEGVETEGQAAMFRMAGCHELQGFYFGMPAPLDQLSGLELRSAA